MKSEIATGTRISDLRASRRDPTLPAPEPVPGRRPAPITCLHADSNEDTEYRSQASLNAKGNFSFERRVEGLRDAIG